MEQLKKKLANYWYHYKYQILLGALGIITVIAALTQCATSVEYDVYLTYAGPYHLTDARLEAAAADCASVLDKDLNGDGEVNAGFNKIFYMTDDQIRDALANDPEFAVPAQEENLEKFKREFEAGDTVIWFVDPSLYAEYSKTDEWVSMLEVIDKETWWALTAELPEEAFDQYSIRLSATEFGQTFFPYLPDDTLICMRRISNYTALMGVEEAEEYYRRGEELFKAIFSYKAN